MENVYHTNETMELIGNQDISEIFGTEQKKALNEVLDARPYSMTKDAVTDVFILGYLHGKRADRDGIKNGVKTIDSSNKKDIEKIKSIREINIIDEALGNNAEYMKFNEESYRILIEIRDLLPDDKKKLILKYEDITSAQEVISQDIVYDLCKRNLL